MATIMADTERMYTIANRLDERARLLNDEIKKLYATTDELKLKWKGTDNDAFSAKMEAQRPKLESLRNVIVDYASKLRETAGRLQKAQDDIAGRAGMNA